MISFYQATSAAYASHTPKDAEGLYFITDTHQVYRGSTLYTGAISLVTGFPAKGAEGTLYIISSTLEGRIWEDNTWKTVAKGYTETVSATSTDIPTAKAVASFVSSSVTNALASSLDIRDISYTKQGNNRALHVTKASGATSDIQITELVTKVVYDAAKLQLTFGISGLADVVVDLPKDNFITGGTYNTLTKNIELSLKDGSKVLIPAASLIDVYTGQDTSTATTTVSADNKIAVSVKKSSTANNKLQINSDGLFVPETDISGKADKLAADTTADKIVTTVAGGMVKDSGKIIGGATLAATPNANTIATEAAVEAIRSALQGSINIVTSGLAEKVDTANVTQSINSATPNAAKIPSEAAIVSAFSWKTI